MTSKTAPRVTAPLGNREFRALWAAETQSVLGDQLTTVALAIMVFDRTGSALWAALVYALTFLPALAGGLGLAQLADRYPRRTILWVTAAMQAVLVGLMAIPDSPIALLCVLIVFARLAGAPSNAAQNALTREVFTEDEMYLRSQDLRGITTNTAMLVGLGGGGLLVSLVGPFYALAADALTFAVAAVLIRRYVRWRPAAGGNGDAWFGALRWVFGQRRLRVLLALSWLVGLAVIPEGLAAPLAHEMGAPSQAVGWLLAADPLGFVAGVFLLSRYASAEDRRRLMGILAVCSVAALIGFALQPALPFALVILALAGAAGAYIITVGATFITWVPNDLRGGAGGLYRTGLRVAQGVGVALGGVVAHLIGSASTAVAFAGVTGVVLAIPVALAWTRVRTADPSVSG